MDAKLASGHGMLKSAKVRASRNSDIQWERLLIKRACPTELIEYMKTVKNNLNTN